MGDNPTLMGDGTNFGLGVDQIGHDLGSQRELSRDNDYWADLGVSHSRGGGSDGGP